MENFNTLVISTAQAICFGRNPDEIVAELAEQNLTSEEVFLVFQAATVFAGGASA